LRCNLNRLLERFHGLDGILEVALGKSKGVEQPSALGVVHRSLECFGRLCLGGAWIRTRQL
ncbi:MAG: hypothetical protein ACC652_14800, partial [Acidimicrobiales bacterium]